MPTSLSPLIFTSRIKIPGHSLRQFNINNHFGGVYTFVGTLAHTFKRRIFSTCINRVFRTLKQLHYIWTQYFKYSIVRQIHL